MMTPFIPYTIYKDNTVEVIKQKEHYDQWVYYAKNGEVVVKLWDECIGTKQELMLVLKDLYNLDAIDVSKIPYDNG